MMTIALSAALVGFIHSLGAAHWLPIVLIAKSRKWSPAQTVVGALVAASGHILLSLAVSFTLILIGKAWLGPYEEIIERYSSLVLVVFGLAYGIWNYRRHSHCSEHSHHGPDTEREKNPMIFLFLMGFVPCVAVVPVLAATVPFGTLALLYTSVGFSVGVVGALSGATLLARAGITALDHPVLEHYGDFIAGMVIAALGVVLFFW